MPQYRPGKESNQPPTIGTQTRLHPTPEQHHQLQQLCTLWGKDLRRVYTQTYDHHTPWFIKGGGGYRNRLMAEGWSRQEADTLYTTTTAAHKGMQKSLQNNLEQTIQQLKTARSKHPKIKNGRVKHILSNRIVRLESRHQHIQQQLRNQSWRVTFGGRKLALAGNDPAKYGYPNYQTWRICWDRARASRWACQGNIIATGGNASAQLVLGEVQDILRLHLPGQLGYGWLEVPVDRLRYRRELYGWMSSPDIMGNEHRRLAWLANPETKQPPHHRLAKTPISYQLHWDQSKQHWYVASHGLQSTTPNQPPVLTAVVSISTPATSHCQ